jgi:hypothetical protein
MVMSPRMGRPETATNLATETHPVDPAVEAPHPADPA